MNNLHISKKPINGFNRIFIGKLLIIMFLFIFVFGCDIHSKTKGTGKTQPQFLSKPPISYLRLGSQYSYTISIRGFPPPSLTITNLPNWLTLSGDVLTGIPLSLTDLDTTTIILTASNGIGPDVTQNVTIIVYMNQLDIPDPEFFALEAFFLKSDGPNWYYTNGWLVGPEPWQGLTIRNGHVEEIDVAPAFLTNIPSEIGDLPFLKIINIESWKLSGSIPTSIGQLTNLKELTIWGDHLTGQIPKEIGNLQNLEILNIQVYYLPGLSGTIPKEIGNLINLKFLYITGKSISGGIPKEIGNLTNLTVLNLSRNKLTGVIPIEIYNLTNLEFLNLCENQLTGSIPPEISNLINLRNLDLGYNQLSGPIPPEIVNLVNLHELTLGMNNLNGPIPHEIENLTNLEILGLAYNQLTGTISITNPSADVYVPWVLELAVDPQNTP